MPDAHEMWYLKTHFTGDAAKLIHHLPIVDENYQAAWRLLQERYDNKRVTVATAIQRLIDQPAGACTISSIKRLHDTTKECLAALDNMDLQTTTWYPLLLHLLVKKLDKAVYTQYEHSIQNPKELQTISHFLSFLENYFHNLEAMGYKEKPSSNNKTCALTTQPHHEIRRCIVCKRDSHQLYRCKKFLLLTPSHRLNLTQKHKLCVNCFNSTHPTNRCIRSDRCQKCGKKTPYSCTLGAKST